MGTAKAADLGGDCCADLEERVAELEATTVRKGNRKVSLTLQGQIDKEIMYYGDKLRSRTVAGVDNINNSTRFFFTGDAKISSSVKAGFEMMVEWAGSTRSDILTQFGPTTKQFYTTIGNAGGTALASNLQEGSGDGALAIRTANWWLEDNKLGRVTVGRVNIGGPSSTIDISGADVGLVASNNIYLQAGGFWLQRTDTAKMSTTNFQTISNWCYGCSRDEGIRWDSVSLGGLLLGAYWGQQDRFTVQARYAGEFGGFQIAAGAGYQHDNQLSSTSATFTDPSVAKATRNDIEYQGYSLAAKHVASGLFLQGMYGYTHWNVYNGVAGSAPLAAGGGHTDAWSWHLQGGWAKNLTGAGMTSVYGEYGHGQGYAGGATIDGTNASGAVVNTTNFAILSGVKTYVASDSVNYYGLGVTQKIDAAAMTLYLGWRHFDPKLSTGNDGAIPLSSFDTVIGGARILF